MARFVPRSLRSQATESETERHTEPVSESREAPEPVTGRPSPAARAATANGARRPGAQPAADAVQSDEGVDESTVPVEEAVATDPVEPATDQDGADAAADESEAAPDDAGTAPDDPEAAPDDADRRVEGARDGDVDVKRGVDGDGEPVGGTDRATTRTTGRGASTRAGAVRPKRRLDPGRRPGGTAEPRIRSGRKVVAAPRAGSNRREKAAQAALRRLRRTALNLAVWAVIFGLLAGTAWYFKHRGEVIEQAGRNATAAASSAAQAIFSYDYRSFDNSVANGKDFVTGDFAEEYAKTTAGLKATAVKERAVVKAKVSVASVTYASPERVEVLLFVNQYRRNVNISGEKVDENRVLLTMEYVEDDSGHGDWLVADAAAI